MQPCIVTSKPVVGVAITSQIPVPGCGTGASHPKDIEEAARFTLEVAKQYGKGLCKFYDNHEWNIILERYGANRHLQYIG
jgi:hypothetical protein